MPTPAYMTVKGVSQGNITEGAFTMESVGNIYQEGFEDTCLIQGFSHTITRPTDNQTGQPTTKRVHKPLVVTKVFDKSSPLLYNALCNGEVLEEVVLTFYRTDTSGTSELYFTITLEDAVITDISSHKPNCQDPGMAHFTDLENISLAYRRITWDHNVANTSAFDDWRAQN